MGKLIIANWKMNPASGKEAAQLFLDTAKSAGALKNTQTVICPPFVFLESLSKVRGQGSKVALGAQDLFWEEKGAFTGEVSPSMLLNSGVAQVIIGHSERRRILGETDEMVNKKVLAALRNELVPIVCVGETTREGKSWEEIQKYIGNQLAEGLKGIEAFHNSAMIIAYEPIWAIGTGVPDKPEDTLRVVGEIKEILNSKFQIQNSRVIYGGSVNAKNAESFLQHREIEGALVGGASLKADEFETILTVAEKYS